MSNLLNRKSLLFILVFLTTSVKSQIIFSESFDEIDNSTIGIDNVGGVNWSTSCPTCLDAGDFFKVVSGELIGQDSNGPATWTTNSIDISNCSFFNISLILKEEGTLEACGTGCTSVDWVQLEYNIDNSGWQLPSNTTFCGGGCAGVDVIQSDDINGTSLNYSTGCISGGTSLQIRITVQTWAASERWILDDISVSCANGPVIDAGLDQSICGEDIALTASNPDNGILTWSNGIIDGVIFTPPLGENTYIVSSDLNGCTATDTIIVTSNPPPTFTLSSSNPTSCNGNNGVITIAGLNSTISYDISYNENGNPIGPLNILTSTSGEILLNTLSAGTYSNFTISISSCSATDNSNIVLSDPSPPIIDAGNDQLVCENSQITLTAVNLDNAILNWNNNVINGIPFTALNGTTTYTVTATLNGCSSLDSLNVTSTPPPSIDAGLDQTICEGTTINLQALNPDGATITWSSNIINGVDFTPNVGNNSYIVYADLNGCIQTDTIDIDVIGLPNITLTSQNPSTCSGNDGYIMISGLSPPFNYDISYQNNSLVGPLSLGSNPQGEVLISNLLAGVYTDFIISNSGCSTQNNSTIILSDPFSPNLDAGDDITICLGDEIILIANNPDGANISWDNGVIDGIPFAINNDQTFIVTAELNNCTNSDSIHISVLSSPTIDAGENKTICRGDSVQLTANSSTTIFSWDNNINDQIFFYPQTTTTYTVSSSIGSCFVSDQVTIFVNKGPDAQFTFNPNNPTVQNSEVTFHPLHADENNYTFYWQFGDHLISSLYEPTHLYNSEESNTYQVSLVLTDTSGCTDTSTTFITVDDILIYYVPNAFTPNNDHLNHTFKPIFTSGFDLYDYHLTIFNRWGEILFESYNSDIGWNGSYIDGELVEGGVYVWAIEFGESKTDKRNFITGHVTVIK